MTGLVILSTDPDGPFFNIGGCTFLTVEQAYTYHYAMTHVDFASDAAEILVDVGAGAAAAYIASQCMMTVISEY